MGLSSEAAGANPKAVTTPFGSTTKAALRTRKPTRSSWRRSSRRKPQEQPLAGSPHPHYRWHQGGVHHTVECRRLGKILGEVPLQLAQLRLQGSDASVELALGAKHREVRAQVRPSQAPEVPLAAQAGPLLGEDGEGEDFRFAQQGRTAGLVGHCDGGWRSRHQRSIMRHHLWVKVWYQHKGSAPSPSSGITHQPSKRKGDSDHRWCEVQAGIQRWVADADPLLTLTLTTCQRNVVNCAQNLS